MRIKGMKGMILIATCVLTAVLCACGNEESVPGGTTRQGSAGEEASEENGTEQKAAGQEDPMEQEDVEQKAAEAEAGMKETTERERQTYLQNPIASVREDAWYDYGTGDPFVMRYNGTYYLYMSTRDTEVGVKCFRSRDLVNWDYQGLCCTEEITKGAYAPEVVYYNGDFYMYTSPGGNGHYVLKSPSPTGPFLVDSDNFGLSIDGSVFMDDDGKWYFLHAGDNCILANEMTAPNEVSPVSKATNTSMSGWTEGAMTIKHDGRYYMTYTGNHVFSKGYRINYAVGDSFERIAPSKDNPVLIHTLGDTYGIGHSSTVKGPDLDSYYIVYHTLIGRAREGMPKREMNIDRIVFNGDKMDILGPTLTGQQMPDFPAVTSYFEEEEELADWEVQGEAQVAEYLGADGGLLLTAGSQVISLGSLGDTFTAEYNLYSLAKQGRIGGYFHYTDEENYGAFQIDLASGKVWVTTVEAGKETGYEMALPESFGEPVDFGVSQTFQVEKKEGTYTLYFQDKAVGTFRCGLKEGAFGYFAKGCEGCFGYMGAGSAAGGDSACTYEKPLPGTVQGIHAVSLSEGARLSEETEGSRSLLLGTAGSSAEYMVRVDADGLYQIFLVYVAEKEAKYRIYMDGADILPQAVAVKGTGGDYNTTPLQQVRLEKGTHVLKLELESGPMEVWEFTVFPYEEVEPLLVEYDTLADEALLYADGTWRVQDGVLKLSDPSRPVGKRLYGSENYGDYSVEADITPLDEDMDVGLLFRVRNPAKGGAGDDAVKGTYFAQGYYAGMTRNGLCLLKINYGREQLVDVPMEFAVNETYHMKAVVEGCVIRVYVGDELCLEYEDQESPFLCGSAGVRGFLCNVDIDNFRLMGLEEE